MPPEERCRAGGRWREHGVDFKKSSARKRADEARDGRFFLGSSALSSGGGDRFWAGGMDSGRV